MLKEGQRQQTIKKEVHFSGQALHSGKNINLRLLPAAADRGIVFHRVDINSVPRIKARPENVITGKRCTTIGIKKNNKLYWVQTIEHLMAACWGLGIDNLLVEVDGSEIPIIDGSAFSFVKLLMQAGIKILKKNRKTIVIKNSFRINRGKKCLLIFPYPGFKISFILDYDHPVIGTQFFEFEKGKNSFIEDLSRARTFGFMREVKELQKNNLAQGGSLENVLLIGRDSVINELRFADEPVRHKIIDVIGDMMLNGYLTGHLICIRSGHSLNIELANKIQSSL